ncbi:MAG TPA: hypothetical protein VI729_04480 [Anaerolineales bacterium]|nr:hypothetical protein [Anaerolineales bacterium]
MDNLTSLARRLEPLIQRQVQQTILSTPAPPASPTLHASLLGLTNDDHSQYVHTATARTITAVHTFNPTVAGAPFVLGANGQGQTVVGLRADQLNKSVVAGSGLTGGGLLTADATLHVGAGTGIAVGVDSVSIDYSGDDPISITPDTNPGKGTSNYAARSDHVHGITCAAPGANSVNLGASAEGSASSFARSDHSHNLDLNISPTWAGSHSFNQTIILSPVYPIYLTSFGNGTYNKTIVSHDTTAGLFFDVARATDAIGGTPLKIQFAHRGGPTAFVIDEYDARVAGGIYVGSLAVDPPAGEIVATGKGTFSKAMVGADPVHGTSYASFWNADLTRVAGNYCILHSSSGDTYINAASTRAITFQINNGTVITINGAGNLLVGTGTDGMTGSGSLAVAQDLAHRGTKVGFYNITPITRQQQLRPTQNTYPTADGTYNGAEEGLAINNLAYDMDNVWLWLEQITDKLQALGLFS